MQKTDSDNAKDFEPSALGRVVIPYAVLSALWILLSDALVSRLFHDPAQITLVSTLKGWAFVAVTSVLLLIQVSRYGARLAQREKMLQESESRFRSFVENANDVLFALTPAGDFSYVSPQWKDAFGYELDETIGRSFLPFVHPDDAPACLAFLQQAISTGQKQSGVEYRVLCKNGTYLWYRANGAIIRDTSAGEPIFVGIGRDITDLKRIEAELIAAKRTAEEANRVKSRFLAAASHDLRQPAQAISLFHDALSRTQLSAEQKRISDYLALSTKSLGDLLDALLDISKFDAGVVLSRPQSIQVHALCRDIDAEFSPLAAAQSLRFKLHFPQREMAIFTDVKLLRSLLNNLIGNAIKYTERGGILVSIRPRGDQVAVQVWDTGVGIATENVDAIFTEYFQIGNPERDRARGLGLGLSIAGRIAKLLGTEIVCRSRLGKGSVFEFRIPRGESQLDNPSAPDEQTTASACATSSLAGLHVVLVEDHLMVAEATRLSMETHGLRVTIFGNAEEALANPEITHADFYISDLGLPGLNGVQFLDALQQRSTKPIKAIVLTGNTAPDQIDIMQATRWKVLFKPIGVTVLLSAIETYDSMD